MTDGEDWVKGTTTVMGENLGRRARYWHGDGRRLGDGETQEMRPRAFHIWVVPCSTRERGDEAGDVRAVGRIRIVERTGEEK